MKAGMNWERAGGLAHDGAVGCMKTPLRKSSSPGKAPQGRG